jgi:hypothetical protein
LPVLPPTRKSALHPPLTEIPRAVYVQVEPCSQTLLLCSWTSITPFFVFAGQKRLAPFVEEQVIVCWAINGRLTAKAAIVIADFCMVPSTARFREL